MATYLTSALNINALAASIATVPFTTEGLVNNEKSLFLYSTDCLEMSKIVRNPKNHEAGD